MLGVRKGLAQKQRDESSERRQAPELGPAQEQGLGPSEESEQGLALCSITLGLAGITEKLEQAPGQEQGQDQPMSVLPAYFARQLLLAAYRFVTQVTYPHLPPPPSV